MPIKPQNFLFRKRNLLPAEECIPSNLNDLLDFLEDALELINLESGSNVNLGTNQPGPDDVDLPWIRTDLDGPPAGLYQFYQGQWRNMGFTVGMQMMFHGTTAEILPPWFIADGLNGTENLTGTGELWIEYRGFA